MNNYKNRLQYSLLLIKLSEKIETKIFIKVAIQSSIILLASIDAKQSVYMLQIVIYIE